MYCLLKLKPYIIYAMTKKNRADTEVKQGTSNGSKQWVSTTKEDFSHSDIYPPVVKLGSTQPDQSLIEKYARPITFWTDFAAKGSGTAICSTPAKTLHELAHEQNATAYVHGNVIGHRAGQVHQHDASVAAIRFGKHPAFSTPIQYLKKGQSKE